MTTMQIGKGARIRLLHTNDPYTKVKPGDEGTIIGTYTDDTGILKVNVNWDSGSNLSLLDGVDNFEYWWPYVPSKEINKK